MENRRANDERALERAIETVRAEASFRVSRSSGPGGQHAQKNETRVEAYLEIESSSLEEPVKQRLRDRFGRTVSSVSQDERSQLLNREIALERLLEKVGRALEPAPERVATKPPRRAILERLAAKRRRSLSKCLRRPPGPED
jgi:ribosome-associated protein